MVLYIPEGVSAGMGDERVGAYADDCVMAVRWC